MSVSQSALVDAIGVETSTGKVVMTISDHLGWEDEMEHIALLREKLDSYLRFVESGELLTAYPAAVGRPVAVDVVARVEPSGAGLDFLRSAMTTMGKAGVELRLRRFRDDSP